MLDRIQTPALNTIELPDSIEAVNDHFYKHGWTDGLPVIPPTAERVERMLSGMSWRSPDVVIGLIRDLKQYGTAVLCISHDEYTLDRLADRRLHLQAGRIMPSVTEAI